MAWLGLHGWRERYGDAAALRGWTLCAFCDAIDIQKGEDDVDGGNPLADDGDAVAAVFAAAARRDTGSLLALYLEGKDAWTEHWVPDNVFESPLHPR